MVYSDEHSSLLKKVDQFKLCNKLLGGNLKIAKNDYSVSAKQQLLSQDGLRRRDGTATT
jgi:hypothetical protein